MYEEFALRLRLYTAISINFPSSLHLYQFLCKFHPSHLFLIYSSLEIEESVFFHLIIQPILVTSITYLKTSMNIFTNL